MGAAGMIPAFPAERFVSHAEYLAERERTRPEREAQRRTEARAAGAARIGTCAPCLRPSPFTAPGPDRERGQHCDCEDRLSARDRVLLHAALGPGGLRGWSRLLLVGPEQPVHRRLRTAAGTCVDRPEVAGAYGHDTADLVVALDCLHRAPDLSQTLRALRRSAAPGAALLARAPFDPEAAVSARSAGGAAVLGWDVLERARAAGWDDADMLRAWSRELGYLGQGHFLLFATRG